MMHTIFTALVVFLVGCATGTAPVRESDTPKQDPDRLLVVDCLLPGQVRKLGQNFSYLAPRRAVKTAAVDCEIRGGEYVAYDRANYATALKVWLPQAQQGDPQAQTYVGEIYEKGLGVMADYKLAQLWYSKAAEQGNSRAQINLGYLYEAGLGVERNLVTAMNWYRKASGLSDAELEYVSSVEVVRREAAQRETAQLKQDVQGLRAQLDNTRRTLAQRKQGLAVAEKELAALRQELESSLQQTGANRQDIVQANVQPDLEFRLQEARSEHERLLSRLAQKALNADELRGQVRRLEERIGAGNQNLDKAHAELSQARAELARLKARGDVGVSTVEVQRLSTRMEALQATAATQQAELARLESEKRDHNRVIQENEQLRQSMDQREREITALQTQLAEAQKLARGAQTMQGQLVDLQQDQQRLTNKLASQQLEASNLRVELSQTTERLSQRREDLDSTKSELSKTRNELEQLRQSAETKRNDPSIQALESRQRDLLAMVETQQQEMRWLEREMQEQQERLRLDLAEAQRSEQQSREHLARRDQQLAELQGQLTDAGQRLGELTLADERLRDVQNELRRRETEVERQRQEIAALQGELTDQAARLERSSSEEIVIAQVVGPTIELIDPPLEATRGVFSINLRSNVAEVDVIGRVTPADRLYSFRVNDQNQDVEANGVFRARIPVRTPNTPVSLVAIDRNAQRAAVDFLIVPKSRPEAGPSKAQPERTVKAPGVRFGNYHALVIGNNEYAHMTNLSTAVNDARSVAEVLTKKYGFKTKLLLNADRYAMLSALNELRERLTDEDNLLIYYAGHGELDNVNLRGYWLPVDAESDSSANWISNVAITDILNTMSAKHVLVVADSCYSGSMTRSALARLQPGMSEKMREKWFKVMVKTRVRAVLTSGGVKPVLDSGGGDHSMFAKAFLEVLSENDGILEGFSLYREVQKRVKHLSATMRVDQDPQYAPIKYAGHEAGEFFFLPSGQRIGGLRPAHSPIAGIGGIASGTYKKQRFSSSDG